MPLLTVEWSEPDEDGTQRAEYNGCRLRVQPADHPQPAAAQLPGLDDKPPRPGFNWMVTCAESGNVDSGWIDTRAAARTEALGRAYLRRRPDVPVLGQRRNSAAAH